MFFMNRETTDKIIVNARNTESNARFVNLRPLYVTDVRYLEPKECVVLFVVHSMINK